MATPKSQNPFVAFMASGAGRLLRAVAGVVLILIGLLVVKGTWGWVLTVVGLVPLAAGLFDFCLLGPLFGAGFWGRDIRRAR
ncbi:DUF2892 domain-containing protein [Thermomicrobium sp. 4228-Ro]|uniref:YgaP family membrane protein n=1 Tax=Thermomicrobium sp. 4228-Ro TaxID=2993937 RepID=UPI002248BE0F|nr:DUF2892 domain-containing protein [Thermomicrobium sp. 4228-Ro]MCX2726776.1 DUF2892 domain-containing protein [Thermomicrobium sp. 4228-Ro]